jgi:aminopeptidase N
MKHLTFVFFLFSLQCFAILPPDQGIDIKHYTFEINLNDSTDIIECVATLKIHITKPILDFNLDLASISEGKGMRVKDVSLNGTTLRFTQQQDKLNIAFTQRLETNADIAVKIIYGGVPSDGLIISKNKYGDRTFFGDNWPDRAHYWLPVIDHPSDKATVDFIVTAPPYYEVIGNGLMLEESFIDEKRKLTHWHEETPISTKVMVVGVARFAIQHKAFVHGIPVEQWVYPQDRLNGFHDFAAAEKILSFFIEHIGPYSYEKLANVQSKTLYGGMENASNIFYFENFVNGKADQDNLIAHEIAHQWFGNSASESDWNHVWLSEGFATYFSHLYNEFTYGTDRRAADMVTDRQTVIDYLKKKSLPVVFNTLPEKLAEILSPNSYEKGSWVLHMLRIEIGDQAFWEGIQLYYKEYRNANASTSDFQRIMESVSNQKLDNFIKQWLYTPGHPVLNASWTYYEKSETLDIIIEQLQNPIFSFPLEIAVYTGNDILPKTEKLKIDQKSNKFSIKVSRKPSHLELDPKVNLLFDGKMKN